MEYDDGGKGNLVYSGAALHGGINAYAPMLPHLNEAGGANFACESVVGAIEGVKEGQHKQLLERVGGWKAQFDGSARYVALRDLDLTPYFL